MRSYLRGFWWTWRPVVIGAAIGAVLGELLGHQGFWALWWVPMVVVAIVMAEIIKPSRPR